MQIVTASETRQNFAAVLGRVAYGKERVTIERRGKPLAVLVPIEDLEALESGGKRAPDESEARLKALVEGSPVEFGVKDRDGRYLMVSREFERLNGKTGDEIIGRSPEDIYPPETAEAIRRHDEEVLKTGKTVEWEIDAPLQDGMHTYLVAKFPVRGADNRITGIGAVATDITEQKKTQAALRKSEELLRSIADNIPGTVYRRIQHRDGRTSYSYISPGVTDMLGLDPDAVTNEAATLTDNIHPDDRAERQRAIEESARTLKPYTINYRYKTPSGETKWIRAIARPRRQDNGDIIWDGITLDVTEAKRVEEALATTNRELQASESKFQSLVSNVPSAIYRSVFDGEWQDEFMSDAIEDITGYPASDFIHNAVRSFMTIVHPDDRETHDRLAEEAVAGKKPFEHEYRIVHAGGGIRWVHDSGKAVYGEDGEPLWFDGAISDITERKRTEVALRESEALTRQAAEMANLGHWVWDEIEDRCVYCSETLARMNGVKVEEYPARFATMEALLEDVHPDDRARYARVISEAKNERRTYDIEFRDLTPNGEFRYLRERGEPILDKNGKLIRSVGTLQDVSDYKRAEEVLRRSHDELELRVQERTRDIEEVNQTLKQEIAERKRAEQALLTSEARAKAAEQQLLDAIESISEGFVLFDSDERFILCNQKYREFFPQISDMLVPGAKLEDLVRTALERHALQETSGTVEEWTRLRLERYRKARGTHEMHLQDGRWLLCSERKTQVGGIVGIRTDITEHKSAEEALRVSEQRLKAIIDNSPTTISLKDASGRYLLTNRKHKDTFAVTEDQVLGAEPDDLLPKDFAAQVKAHDRIVLETRRTSVKEHTAIFHGETRTLLATKFPILGDDGSIQGIGSMATDITESKRAEEALRESESRAKAAEEQLLDAIESISEGFILYDSDERFILCNQKFHEFYPQIVDMLVPGTKLEDIARSAFERSAVRGARENIDEWMRIRLESHRKGKGTHEQQLADGRWLLCSERRTRAGGAVGIRTDITERKGAEEALRESEARFRAIIDNSPATISLKDLSGRYILINRTYRELVGLSADEVQGLAPGDFLSEELAAAVAAHHKTVLESGETVVTEELMPLEDGLHTFLAIKFPIKDDSGNLMGVGSIATDITDQKRAEETLRESAERLRQATQLAGLGHWVWDAIEDRCIYCSEEHARIHGITPEEYMARAATLDGDSSLIHPDDRKRMKATFRSLRNGHGFETEYRVVTPSGDARWVREIAKPVFDDTGTVVREYGTTQDISERRQAEETIRTREAWLSAILENAPIDIVLKDTGGKIFLANEKSLEGLGVTLDQVLGKHTSDFLPHDIAKIYEDADRLVLESGEPTQKEVTEHRSGRTYHYLSSKFPLKDETNEILGICSITTDISRITEVQNQLRQAQKMEAVGQLTGGVAHDFNNLMAVVMGNVELLSDRIGADDPQIQAIMQASTRGAELTQRLLAFSRQQPLHPRPVDLEALVEGMTHLLSRTLGETIEIDVSSSPNLWAALADSGQVENALLNLTLNARDAMPGGGTLTIETANAKLNRHDIAGREDTRPGDYVVLVVRDTGHGIPPEVLEHVFEPFFTTKDVGEGTGLGLSMVYGFAQQSGGHITIDSAEGQGTIVKLYLPRVTEAEKEASEETATSETIPRARGEAVLVIEDDPAVRELTVTILESLGYHVMAARNEKAVSKILATNERIDLVLCDVVLPGGRSGPDFAAEAMLSRPNVRLLFMSGYASEELPPSLHDGVVLLNKPFRKAELAIKLREVLDGD